MSGAIYDFSGRVAVVIGGANGIGAEIAPIEALQSAPDYQHYLDKQLAPAADGILHFLDTSFRDITDSQMQMF